MRTTSIAMLLIALAIFIYPAPETFAHEYPTSLATPLKTDAAGWTVFDVHPESRSVYVSSSAGSDSNLGDSPEKAVRSLARAMKLIRNGKGDRMLLRAGDEWNEDFGVWPYSGVSAEFPAVITSFGDGPRPVVRPGANQGFRVMNRAVKHAALVGIRFEAPEDPYAKNQTGVGVVGPLSDFLIEDCYFQGFAFNVTLQSFAGPVENVRLRRNVIVDALNVRERNGEYTPGHSSGLFANEVKGLLVEECVFDYNGWREGVVGAERSTLNHNIYIQWNCSDVVVRRNISARGSNSGIMVRCGGLIEENVEMSSPSAIAMGSHKGDGAMFSGTVRRNLLLHGSDLGDSRQAWGLGLTNVENSVAEDNVVLHVRSDVGQAISFSSMVRNTIVRRNVAYRWGTSFDVSRQWDDVAIENNVFVTDSPRRLFVRVRTAGEPKAPLEDSMCDNVYILDEDPADTALKLANGGGEIPGSKDRSVVNYASLNNDVYARFAATIETYQESVGGTGGMEGFLAEARKQSKAHWREAYEAPSVIAYFREAFKPLIAMTQTQ